MNSYLGICQKISPRYCVYNSLAPSLILPRFCAMIIFTAESLSPPSTPCLALLLIWSPNSLCTCAHGNNQNTVIAMHLFMVVRLRLEYPHLQWWLNFCCSCIPSKSCHNCNVESDRALCARGWGLPAWPRALHCACGAWEDSGIWGWLRRRWAGTAAAPWPHALAASPAPRPWAVNLRPGSSRWEVLGFSFTGQTEQQCPSFLWRVFSASLHPQALLSDCRESCFLQTA